MHMTSLCPDQCNHANAWQLFDVETYHAYSKPGQYGDEQGTQFALQIRPVDKVEHGPGVRELAATLAPGDVVRMQWLHEYHRNSGGGSYPVRRVTTLTRV